MADAAIEDFHIDVVRSGIAPFESVRHKLGLRFHRGKSLWLNHAKCSLEGGHP